MYDKWFQSSDLFDITVYSLALNCLLTAVAVKFGLSEKHTKFDNIFLMVLTNQLTYLVNVKTIRMVAHIFVAFSEKLNFINSEVHIALNKECIFSATVM